MAKLHKKDFERIATSFINGRDKREVALYLSDYLETTNEQFNKQSFLKACEVTE